MSNILSNLKFKIICLFVAVVGLLLFNSSTTFAVTDAELDSMGLDLNDWTLDILEHYNIDRDNQSYLVFNAGVSSNDYYLFVFPNVSANNKTLILFPWTYTQSYYNNSDGICIAVYNGTFNTISDLSSATSSNLLSSFAYVKYNMTSANNPEIVGSGNLNSLSSLTVYLYVYYNGRVGTPPVVTTDKFIIDKAKAYYFGFSSGTYSLGSSITPLQNFINYSSINDRLKFTNFDRFLYQNSDSGTTQIQSTLDTSSRDLLESISGFDENIIDETATYDLNQSVDVSVNIDNSNRVIWDGRNYYDHVELYYKFKNVFGEYGSVYNYSTNDWNDFYYAPFVKLSVYDSTNDKLVKSTDWLLSTYDVDFSSDLISLQGILKEAYLVYGDTTTEHILTTNLYIDSPAWVKQLVQFFIEKFDTINSFYYVVDFKIEKHDIIGDYDSVKNLGLVYSKQYIVDFDNETGIATTTNLYDENNNIIAKVVTKDNTLVSYELVNSTDYNVVVIDDEFTILKNADSSMVYSFEYDNNNNWVIKDNDNEVVKSYIPIEARPVITDDNLTDNDFDIGANVNSILLTIGDIFSGLYSSILSMTAIFSVIFNWLPAPIPQMIIFLFCLAVLFAIIRVIRG